MINKRSIWFMTLFIIIIAITVYYITIPNDKIIENKPVINIEESTILTALRVESDKEMESMMNDLRLILSSIESSSEEKNKAYEQLKQLNITRGEEEKLEQIIKTKFNLNSFIKITDDQIRVVILSNKHDNKLAQDIMKNIQSNYETYKYISIKFE